jgi:hypothetical protein
VFILLACLFICFGLLQVSYISSDDSDGTATLFVCLFGPDERIQVEELQTENDFYFNFDKPGPELDSVSSCQLQIIIGKRIVITLHET